MPEPIDWEPFDILAETLTPFLIPRLKIDETKLAQEVESMVNEQVKKLVVPQNITIRVGDREYKLDGIQPHKNFGDLAYLAGKRKNIYLHGNPGWGKSEAAFQIAKLLKLDFDYITLVLALFLTVLFLDTRISSPLLLVILLDVALILISLIVVLWMKHSETASSSSNGKMIQPLNAPLHSRSTQTQPRGSIGFKK